MRKIVRNKKVFLVALVFLPIFTAYASFWWAENSSSKEQLELKLKLWEDENFNKFGLNDSQKKILISEFKPVARPTSYGANHSQDELKKLNQSKEINEKEIREKIIKSMQSLDQKNNINILLDSYKKEIRKFKSEANYL